MDESTRPKPFAFVLMPFSSAFRDIYEFGIRQACEETGAYCERVDEQIFDGTILQRVYNQIAKADIVIADMTGRNPNVFYETGYAHALDKRVLLLTQAADDIPFDLKHFPHIVYEGQISKLKPSLIQRIRWCVDNPKGDLSTTQVAARLLVNGQDLESNPLIECDDVAAGSRWIARVELQVHNVGRATLDPSSCSVGLVVPVTLTQAGREKIKPEVNAGVEVYRSGRIDGETSMIEFSLTRALLPDARESFVFALAGAEPWQVTATGRLFTKISPHDYVFALRCGRGGS